MPRLCPVSPQLPGLIAFQDYVIHRDQAMTHGLTPDAIRYRVRQDLWQILLPDVYLTTAGEPSRRQMLIATQLYVGRDGAIDGPDACRYHGISAVAVDPDRVHACSPWSGGVQSNGFVVVRRTTMPIVASEGLIRYVMPATAVISATRRMKRERSVLAAMSDALQRRTTSYEELVRAHLEGSPRNSKLAEAVLSELGGGVLSVAEADFRRLASKSSALARLEYNVWLRLPTGQRVCVDALDEDSAFVHETNGRRPHAREDLFEDMQIRHDALTVAGLTVLHNSPRRIRCDGAVVIRECEVCVIRDRGRGLPPGVTRTDPPDFEAAA